MKISYNWLQDYLPVVMDPMEIGNILTTIGLEVEALDRWESVPGGLDGLIVGEVKEVVRHPNADKLSLTKVSIGNGNLLSIVCGAPNVAAGQRVIVAPVDTTLHPLDGEPFTIRTAKIRGEESEGMLCAEDEIGLGKAHEGILILGADAAVGSSVAEYLGVVRDWVLDIAVTPNRSDAMSHMGVARDLLAYLSFHRGEKLSAKMPEHTLFAEGTSNPIAIAVEDSDACPRYSGLTIDAVRIGASPVWMQNRLKAIDARPINNVVDVTNYVLHEMGQPLHAFDADKIGGSRVVVKTLNDGTPFTTLDEQERKLSSRDLMICDAEGGMCIAGVFGGVGSGVSDNTQRIFLESAHFNPTSVRRTSFGHNLRTEAAMRFEKGTDPHITLVALKRAAHLLKQLNGQVTFSSITDVFSKPTATKTISTTYHVMDRLVGAEISASAARPILEGLGMRVQSQNDSISVDVPSWKHDMEHAADLVEEVLRIYGMDRIDISERFITAISPVSNDRYKMRDLVADWLASNGFHEMQSLSMTSAAYYSAAEQDQLARLINPLSSELEVMRASMLHNGLEHIARNHNHRSLDLKLFEFGRVYGAGAQTFVEAEKLAVFLSGAVTPETWERPQEPASVYIIKAIGGRILDRLGLNHQEAPAPLVHLINGLQFSDGETVLGHLGQVDIQLLREFDIKQPVFYAELNWDACTTARERVVRKVSPLPRFPAIRRDLAVVLDESIPYAAVQTAVRSWRSARLQSVDLFDIYRDEKIGSGKKSLALSFTFRDETRTMTDSEADEAIAGIVRTLQDTLNATIRTS